MAAAQGQECYKYYLLTPNNDVMCKDKDDKIVADNLGDRDDVGYSGCLVWESIRQYWCQEIIHEMYTLFTLLLLIILIQNLEQ